MFLIYKYSQFQLFTIELTLWRKLWLCYWVIEHQYLSPGSPFSPGYHLLFLPQDKYVFCMLENNETFSTIGKNCMSSLTRSDPKRRKTRSVTEWLKQLVHIISCLMDEYCVEQFTRQKVLHVLLLHRGMVTITSNSLKNWKVILDNILFCDEQIWRPADKMIAVITDNWCLLMSIAEKCLNHMLAQWCVSTRGVWALM